MNPTHVYGNIALTSTWNKKYFGLQLQREPKHTFYVQLHFSENLGVYKTMWENMVQPDRPQMTIHYGAEEMRIAYRRKYRHTQQHDTAECSTRYFELNERANRTNC